MSIKTRDDAIITCYNSRTNLFKTIYRADVNGKFNQNQVIF